MQKVLILSSLALGDCVSCTLTLANNLAKTHQVYCITNTTTAYKLFREIPCFYCVIQSDNHRIEESYVDQKFVDVHVEKYTDLAKQFSLYDKVYLSRVSYYNHFIEFIEPSLIANLVHPIKYDFESQPPKTRSEMTSCYFGFTETDHSININWYKHHYHDFKCLNNTVLFNGLSDQPNRTYARRDEVVQILKSSGFDVRQLDLSVDIRTNIHLINQAPYILTTDTSTFWLAKSLGKSPYVFISNSMYKNSVIQQLLGSKNIIENKGDMNKTEPQEIVSGFLAALRSKLLV